MRITPTDRVFVLTGAGVSAESGLPTFRSEGGIWSGPVIQDVCTPEAWEKDPWRVWEFYASRRTAAFSVKPNPAHLALAELEAQMGDRFFLCTQNVDDLHEQAGSRRMVHIHGELGKSRCSENCGLEPVVDRRVYGSLSEVSRCPCGALQRPHVVFFDEVPLELDRVEQEMAGVTMLVVIGTSGVVKPAAELVGLANELGARTVYVGPEAPANGSEFSQILFGKAGEIIPHLFTV